MDCQIHKAATWRIAGYSPPASYANIILAAAYHENKIAWVTAWQSVTIPSPSQVKQVLTPRWRIRRKIWNALSFCFTWFYPYFSLQTSSLGRIDKQKLCDKSRSQIYGRRVSHSAVISGNHSRRPWKFSTSHNIGGNSSSNKISPGTETTLQGC